MYLQLIIDFFLIYGLMSPNVSVSLGHKNSCFFLSWECLTFTQISKCLLVNLTPHLETINPSQAQGKDVLFSIFPGSCFRHTAFHPTSSSVLI